VDTRPAYVITELIDGDDSLREFIKRSDEHSFSWIRRVKLASQTTTAALLQ